jgi:hypothetical protein
MKINQQKQIQNITKCYSFRFEMIQVNKKDFSKKSLQLKLNQLHDLYTEAYDFNFMGRKKFEQFLHDKGAKLFIMYYSYGNNLPEIVGCLTLIENRIYQIGILKIYNGLKLGSVMLQNLALTYDNMYCSIGTCHPGVIKTFLNSGYHIVDTVDKIINTLKPLKEEQIVFSKEHIFGTNNLVFQKLNSSSKFHGPDYKQVLVQQNKEFE